MKRALVLLALVVVILGSVPAVRAETVDADAAPPISEGGAMPAASDARIAGDDERTRFILDLSDEVDIGTFTLGDPYRVIIDLPEVAFNLPDDAGLTGRGLVSGWRYGLFARGRSRIVLDTAVPVKIDGAFILASVDGQPARLVVDLVKTTPAEFQAELQRTSMTREASNTLEDGKSDLVAIPIAPKRAKPLVMLDPGHGGIDAGTSTASGVLEKDIVLSFAFELKSRLEATGKVEVVMTRDDDRFIALRDRVQMAREQAADLFVSIHADSVQEGDVRGATVYTLSEKASDTAAAALAAKENAADLAAGLDSREEADEVSDILMDLTRRETRNFSTAFAHNLVTELSNTTRMIKNPKRSAGFWVLKAPDVPSVLLEIGYLSNAEDEKLLTSEDWRTKVSEAVGSAILRFFGPKFADAGR